MAKLNDPCDVVMGDGNSDAAQTAKQSRRRLRRRKKSAQEQEPADEVLALTDADVVEPEPATGKSSRRSLRAHTSASRSPPPVADRTTAAVGASAVKTTLSPPQEAVLTGESLLKT